MAASAAPPWLLDADLAAQKHEEAVAVAVEKCGEDTGVRHYICTQALHWKTKGARAGSCRGRRVSYVSCLAEQAKILVAEAEENNLGRQIFERWARWHKCRLCEQDHHGLVCCALGGVLEDAWGVGDGLTRVFATAAYNGLLDGGHYETRCP